MSNKTIAPYGSWRSPITASQVAAGTVSISQVVLDGNDIYWTETRPRENGRVTVIKHTSDGQDKEVVQAPYNVRTRVHEYGGGAYTVNEGVIYFSNFSDQRLYRIVRDQQPQPLTPDMDLRYADFRVDPLRNLLYSVREDHTSGEDVTNTIVSIDLQVAQQTPQAGKILVAGNDFYSNPRLSPDGSHFAWLTWNHPNMPWDGSQLWVGELDRAGNLEQPMLVAGGPQESIFQPEWSPDGVLYFVSDRTGWWNLYRQQGDSIQAIYPLDAEFGLPQWVFGLSRYGFESSQKIFCIYHQEGKDHLESLDTRTLRPGKIKAGYPNLGELKAAPGKVVFTAGSPTEPISIIELNPQTGNQQIIRRSSQEHWDRSYFTNPQEIEFPTENGLTAYAFYYPPHNPDYAAPPGELPPLIVMTHGGPTSSTSTTFRLGIQYFTSRGLAILDVNYGGSTGYGRDYRQRLQGTWGIVDVDDSVNGALYLARQGLVDPDRLAIVGGSAGGYTTLSALTFRDVFKAGASYYGIGDLETLFQDSHKFEARYNEGLVGPYPQAKEVYYQRSPIHFTDRLNAALILFQGQEDMVVPPAQAEAMYQAVLNKGLPVAYLKFAGEGHGFRKAETIQRTLEAELYFYSQVFHFPLAEQVEPVDIQNMGRATGSPH